MGVRIEINKAAISQRVAAVWQKSLFPLSEQALKDCNLYVKMDQKTLRASSEIKMLPYRCQLVWDTPYAARQHYEIPTASKDENPNARWYWTRYAKNHHKESWLKIVQKCFKENL